jgi:predicted nucleotidyltransferase
MRIDEIKSEIKRNKEYLKQRFFVNKIGLFGSFIQGEEVPESDVDILVEFNKGHKDFFNYMRLKYYLEDLLDREVDLVMKDSVKPQLKKEILSQVVYV